MKFMQYNGRKYLDWEDIPAHIRDELLLYLSPEWRRELIGDL